MITLLAWIFFSSDLFLQNFSPSKIFVKLLSIWAGLDVFPFKMMKKEASHRVQHVKISRNWSSNFVGHLCACLRNQTLERQWKMCSTGLTACNLGYGVSVHESAMVVMANMANTGKTVQVVRWSSRKRRVVQACWTRAWRNDFSRTPFPPKAPKSSPKWGKNNFFLHCHKKMPILFHSGNKRQFKLCPKSVSNYQNQWGLFIKMATDWQVSEVGDTCRAAAGPGRRRSVTFCRNCASRVSRAFECPPLTFPRNKDE